MNIFKYNGKDFDEKINEIFDNISNDDLKEELISCGLDINSDNYTQRYYPVVDNNEKYSKKEKRKFEKPDISIEYNIKINYNEGENIIWKNNETLLVA